LLDDLCHRLSLLMIVMMDGVCYQRLRKRSERIGNCQENNRDLEQHDLRGEGLFGYVARNQHASFKRPKWA